MNVFSCCKSFRAVERRSRDSQVWALRGRYRGCDDWHGVGGGWDMRNVHIRIPVISPWFLSDFRFFFFKTRSSLFANVVFFFPSLFCRTWPLVKFCWRKGAFLCDWDSREREWFGPCFYPLFVFFPALGAWTGWESLQNKEEKAPPASIFVRLWKAAVRCVKLWPLATFLSVPSALIFFYLSLFTSLWASTVYFLPCVPFPLVTSLFFPCVPRSVWRWRLIFAATYCTLAFLYYPL